MKSADLPGLVAALAPAATGRDVSGEHARLAWERLVNALPPHSARELTIALRVVDHPATGLLYSRRWVRASRDIPERASRRLERMMTSRLPLVRAIAGAVRRAVAAVVYSDPTTSAEIRSGD